jgi:hypothetical protein
MKLFVLALVIGTVSIAAVLTVPPAAKANPLTQSREQPIDVVKAYLQASYARDFATAYRFISSIDRRIRDEKTYLRSQENFDGFALELARKLAAEMKVWVIDQKINSTKARVEVGYRVPTGDEIASQLFDWNLDKLNALSPDEQHRLFETVDSVKNRGKMITIEGRETFDLVSEKSGWKIFLDWSSRARIVFKALQPRSSELEVQFLRNDFLVKIDDPFQIDFTVRNRTDRSIVITLNHRFEPPRMAENIDMIACGSVAPFRLRPQEVRELSSNYLLRGPVQKSERLSIIYDFSAQPTVAKRKKAP